ncbi:MAG TPA: SBBP repeat-containing protein, partial [Candidatus Binataceae bacterium]|nr:SBBP repeat-containing protein [Candidatus Binataceae bacterium]
LGTNSAGDGIAVDSIGEAVLVGTTRSAIFPVTPGSFQSLYPGNISNPLVGFISKLNFEGTGLIFSTFMGLSDGGWPSAVALDSSADVYVSGGTSTGVNYDSQSCAPDICGFIVELDSGGATVDFSDIIPFATLLGIATDSAGNAHVIATRGGGLLINLDSAGNPSYQMLSLGGTPNRIAIGPSSDNIFLTGVTNGGMLDVTSGAYQSTYGGAGDAFVSVLDPTGFFNLYTTYLGGSGLELAQGIAVDGAENAYVTGTTQSGDFPVTPGVFEGEHPNSGNGLAFVARIVPVLQSPTATMTVSATPVTTPISTFMNPPTPTTPRTPLPTHSTNATPIPTITIPTPIQTVQGAGTPTLTVAATATATGTATVTASPTPSPTPTTIGTLRIAPLTITFPRIKVGKESGFRAVRLANPRTNKGPAMLTNIVLQSQLDAMPVGFEIDAQSTCRVGTPIALGRVCRIYLRFAPLAVGSVADTLVISGNFTGNAIGPVGLVGTGR